MKTKTTIKRIVDCILILLLPAVMLLNITGQTLHEIFGTAMFVAFIVHHLLNLSWHKNLFKGGYSLNRGLNTLINILLTFIMLSLIVSGVLMSNTLYKWITIKGTALTMKKLHLMLSYWGLILMSAHVGLHYGAMTNGIKKMLHISGKNAARTVILRLLALAVSAYGIYAFVTQKIYMYLFLQTHFLMFDFAKPKVLVILETIAMVILFAVVFYYLQKLLSKIKLGKKAQTVNKYITFVLSTVTIIAVVITVI